MSAEAEEPDRLKGAPHPREQLSLFGHEKAEHSFLSAFNSERLHHAWLLGGPMGIGKATFAYRIARFLLAQQGTDKSLFKPDSLAIPADHPAVRQVMVLSHPDLIVLRRTPSSDKKAASTTIPVDAVRRAVHLFGSTAGAGGYRVAIVDCAEDLTASSANALLKLIEEPPSRSVFLIVSHAPQRILPTIKSRCRLEMLEPLKAEDARKALLALGSPWHQAEEERLEKAVTLAEGSMRRAAELIDPNKAGLIERLNTLMSGLPAYSLKDVMALAEDMNRKVHEADFDLVLESLQRFVTQKLHDGSRSLFLKNRLVEAYDETVSAAHQCDIYNLDKRPLILKIFQDMSKALG